MVYMRYIQRYIVFMKRYLSGLLLLFIFHVSPILCLGQADRHVTLQGVVVDADSLTPLPYVHILVKNASLGSATAVNGQFNVSVNIHDTIVFTSVGYKPYLLVPADSTEESLSNLVIPMRPHISELEEVTVKAYDDITKYIRREEKPFNMNRSKATPLFERKEPEERKAVQMATGTNGAALEGAVTAFANLFNDKYQQEKKLKKLLEIEEVEKRQQYLREIMTEKYQAMVAQVSDLSEADIHQFTAAYMPDPQIMANMNDYSIMVGILENLEKFQPKERESISVDEILEKGVFEGEEKPKP